MSRAADLAIAAASQAATATAELLEFARSGPLAANGNFQDEPVEKLADALQMTLQIELAEIEGKDDLSLGDSEYRSALNQLLDATSNFLEDWAG